ncbi:Arrestin-like protein [Macrophomina phaseolina MS6]|uniref:Arrestin-like protein n=1 Tax=Macrophomina phaseolina (strain MS6) TaxID=1126212 RepID=K2R4J8_MACPH|nr:Arrestin-like protein [Macrophomina phaseolina MS6]
MTVTVRKVANIKKLDLHFIGKSKTEWPKGIGPNRTIFNEERTFLDHVWRFVNTQADDARGSLPTGHRAASDQPRSSGHLSSRPSFDPKPENSGFSNGRGKGSDIFQAVWLIASKEGNPEPIGRDAHIGFEIFHPGVYVYNFDLPLDNHLPESIKLRFGNVKYYLKISIERPKLFRRNLSGTQEVRVIRAPATESWDQSSVIANRRNWRGRAYYEVVLFGKSFRLGSAIPIFFKFTPLSKVRCRGINVLLAEEIEFRTSDETDYRWKQNVAIPLLGRTFGNCLHELGPMRNSVLAGPIEFDSRGVNLAGADIPFGSDADHESGSSWADDIGAKEIELSVHLPHHIATAPDDEGMHLDTTFHDIRIQHKIKRLLLGRLHILVYFALAMRNLLGCQGRIYMWLKGKIIGKALFVVTPPAQYGSIMLAQCRFCQGRIVLDFVMVKESIDEWHKD